LWNMNVYYRIHKCPPPVPILIQLIPLNTPHTTSWIYNLILYSHLRVGLPSGFFPSGFLTKQQDLMTPTVKKLVNFSKQHKVGKNVSLHFLKHL
jgi:hypothetical protein